jgi:hypothetical protein
MPHNNRLELTAAVREIMTPSMSWQRIIRHLIRPSIATAILICLNFTPKSVFGCVNRGLMALAVVLIGMMAAVPAAITGAAAKRRGSSEEANGWTVTTLILVSPPVLLLGPLG